MKAGVVDDSMIKDDKQTIECNSKICVLVQRYCVWCSCWYRGFRLRGCVFKSVSCAPLTFGL